jgi:hypothetical protein
MYADAHKNWQDTDKNKKQPTWKFKPSVFIMESIMDCVCVCVRACARAPVYGNETVPETTNQKVSRMHRTLGTGLTALGIKKS